MPEDERSYRSSHVTREELVHLEEKIDARLDEVLKRIDSKAVSARQVWLGVSAMVITILAMGGALVAFGLNSATAPIEANVNAIDRLSQTRGDLTAEMAALRAQNLELEVERLRAIADDVREMSGRVGVVESLVMRDVRIDHGEGGDGVTSARLEQTMNRQTELWQLLETIDLRLDKMSERLVAIEGSRRER